MRRYSLFPAFIDRLTSRETSSRTARAKDRTLRYPVYPAANIKDTFTACVNACNGVSH
ncbi:MAG: hypothetical protein HOC23_07535 [Halieaceae bacterium]|nr:hypothetical protein [Halieaceae bacterium]